LKNLFKDLWLVISLIVVTSAILLLSDLEQRRERKTSWNKDLPASVIRTDYSRLAPEKTTELALKDLVILDFSKYSESGDEPSSDIIMRADGYENVALHKGRAARIAVINLVENLLGEEAEHGLEEGLKEMGLKVSEDYILKKHSAQGEISQLPQIIDAVVREKPDVIVTVTTPVFIAVLNKVKDIPVVFTVCSDPVKLGLFADERPPNVCGVHDNPPVDELLEMAKKYDNTLKSVGIVYDAAQINSLISVEKLRKAGKQKQIRILEATASSVSDLSMATQSLIQRGAQAIFISADNLANTGFSVIHRAASSAGIPVFTTEPGLVPQGATGAIGDSFFDWGRQSGKLVARIIAGIPPNLLPITETEVQHRVEPVGSSNKTGTKRPFKLRMVLYSETEFSERARDGLIDGIMQAGLVEGPDYQMRIYNAQGDMSALSSIMSNIRAERVDLLMVISTPALQAALRQAGAETTIVFTCVADGVKAGAGKSETDHLSNVTGITTRSSFSGMARLISETLPGTKRVGTLFTPAEINSVIYKDLFDSALRDEGIELIALPVTSSAEIAQAAAELCRKNIQVLSQVVDNLTRPGFALIARKAAENNIPVYVFDSDQMKDGGAICLARDYYDAGLEAAELAIRILRGENPGDIPFANTQSEKLLINYDLAKKYNLILSEELRKEATPFTP